jgi:pimeloyl-ACP methyl ester carboxylesterase
MPGLKITTGYSKNGLPYARFGDRKNILVVFDGLDFSHKPPGLFAARMGAGYVKALAAAGYTVYQVRRKPGLPKGYTMKDMADDYAVMIKDELRWPVDVMGTSTGGPVAQCFGAYHPELTRRLVLACTGCRLLERGKILQLGVADLTRRGKWRAGAALMAGAITTGVARFFLKSFMWLMGRGAFESVPDPSDGIVEIEAEDVFDFREHLAEIKTPTLVIGGDKDFFYDLEELAAGIPGAKLVLYKGAGHAAPMKRKFAVDLLSFLTTGTNG